jgi:protein gp37
MGERTAIEWTDATWNPWRGCDKVSPGCAHCYMFRDQLRYGRDPSIVVEAAEGTFYAPLRSRRWREAAFEEAHKAGRERPLIFTCSWSDFFHEVADQWRDEAWDIIRGTPEFTYQVLTKRPERIRLCLPGDWGDGWPNVWLGTSIENRKFVGRADALRATPAAVRFISAEPLLGPLVLKRNGPHAQRGPFLDLAGIDWLIVGGESGPQHRPIDPEWVRDLRRECVDTPRLHRPAFFFKQWGGSTPKAGGRELDGRAWDEMPAVAGTDLRWSADSGSHQPRLSDGAVIF